MAAEEPPDLDKELPYELVPGTYANLLEVWFTAHEFTLDFGVHDPSGDRSFRVVSRVRVPITLSLDMLQELNRSMTVYERRFGAIERPTEPENL